MKKILLIITLFAVVVSQSMVSCSEDYENISDTREQNVMSDSVKTPLVITMRADISKEVYGGTRAEEAEESVWKNGDVIYLAFEGGVNAYGEYNDTTEDWSVSIKDGVEKLYKNAFRNLRITYIEGMPASADNFAFSNTHAVYQGVGKFYYNTGKNTLTISANLSPMGGRLKFKNIPTGIDSFTVHNIVAVHDFNVQQLYDDSRGVRVYYDDGYVYGSGLYAQCPRTGFSKKNVEKYEVCLYGLYLRDYESTDLGLNDKYYRSYYINQNNSYIPYCYAYNLKQYRAADNYIWVTYNIVNNNNKYDESSGDYMFYRERPDCFLKGKSGYTNFPTLTNASWGNLQITGYTPRGKQGINKTDEKEDENCMWVDLDLPSGTKWAAYDKYGADYTLYKTAADKGLFYGTNTYGTDCKWGDRWELPTVAQFQELVDYTIVTRYTDKNGILYYKFEGSGGQYLLLPAAAGINQSTQTTTTGMYMTSDKNSIFWFDGSNIPKVSVAMPMAMSHRYVLKK